eukprot:NODE_2326_length_1087_cov_76.577083_g2308_i0.p1 GENE.NODE_2326_length_1087_cov_76.577083_g2308_i0~~NODE_2326_length_1087_cov_76.577083_g2308_i0.p1  ORF type:complete len:267 (+),score=33.61 NODE_2326_length_1087_cov_76.577083_g2308_i0:77-877(+)
MCPPSMDSPTGSWVHSPYDNQERVVTGPATPPPSTHSWAAASEEEEEMEFSPLPFRLQGPVDRSDEETPEKPQAMNDARLQKQVRPRLTVPRNTDRGKTKFDNKRARAPKSCLSCQCEGQCVPSVECAKQMIDAVAYNSGAYAKGEAEGHWKQVTGSWHLVKQTENECRWEWTCESRRLWVNRLKGVTAKDIHRVLGHTTRCVNCHLYALAKEENGSLVTVLGNPDERKYQWVLNKPAEYCWTHLNAMHKAGDKLLGSGPPPAVSA